jgi:hypothetical protein
MKSKKDFELQLLALGMEPADGESLDSLFQLYEKLADDPNQTGEILSKLKPLRLNLQWDDSEYEPEDALKKRCIQLSEDFVAQAKGNFPEKVNQDCGEAWHHLVMHGKCGMMALLFSLEKVGDLKVEQIAPMIETFMTYIDEAFDQCLQQEDQTGIAKALRIAPEGEFKSFVTGRMQAFGLMRSTYLEDKTKKLSPLQWWVQHERYIPALPE